MTALVACVSFTLPAVRSHGSPSSGVLMGAASSAPGRPSLAAPLPPSVKPSSTPASWASRSSARSRGRQRAAVRPRARARAGGIFFYPTRIRRLHLRDHRRGVRLCRRPGGGWSVRYLVNRGPRHATRSETASSRPWAFADRLQALINMAHMRTDPDHRHPLAVRQLRRLIAASTHRRRHAASVDAGRQPVVNKAGATTAGAAA